MSRPTVIAIDGPVASGKTAVGRSLARRLGFQFLDTGIMYRAVTWEALRRGVDLENEVGLVALARSLDIRIVAGENEDRLTVDGADVTAKLKEPEVERGVSLVSSVPGVRRAMVAEQRALAAKGSIVVVGRDIGTVVLPDAPVKVYLNASIDVRVGRRHRELLERDAAAELDEVKNDIRRRDNIDSQRADSPLRPADDAVQIDTDAIGIEETAQKIEQLAGHVR